MEIFYWSDYACPYCYIGETNLKAAGTRNRCIKEAKGEYIAIQDADDYSMPDRIEKLLACFGENDVDFVSSAANLFSKDEHTFDSVFRCDKRFPKKKDFLWRLPFIHASTMFKTECIRAVDGYRVAKETTRGQDYDMFMRLYAAGFKGMNVPNPLYCIRADAGYIDRQIKRSARDECRVRIYGFKLLKLMPIGYLFALKPYAATFYHMIFRK